MRVSLLATWALTLPLFACSDDPPPTPPTDAGSDAFTIDAGGDAGTDSSIDIPCDGPPGLYASNSCVVLADGVDFFEPAHQLWADDADKERFIFLPSGMTIDTTDPDGWIFPVGTKLWKTFSLDGMRIETRLLEKINSMTGVDGRIGAMKGQITVETPLFSF